MKLETMICEYIRGVPKAFYDIGVGLKTEWLHIPLKYPDIKVFGCEPCKVTREAVIEKGFKGDNYKMFPVGIGAPDQTQAKLRVGHQVGSRDASIHPIPNFAREETIDLITLDQFDKKCGKPESIILWMDIEGYELIALESGPELMKSGRVRWINLEVHINPKAKIASWPDPMEIHDFLNKHGYKMVKQYNNHGTHHDRVYVSVENP